jgi:cytochrome c peroxidase
LRLLRRILAGWFLALVISACGGGSAPQEGGLTRLEFIGKSIFFDVTLSNPRGQGCVSCHDPATGFSGNFGSATGVPLAADGSTLGLRNTPTAAYASFAPPFTIETTGTRPVARGGQFLDGRAASLEEQAGMPFFSRGEMNIADAAELAAKLANAPYAVFLQEQFGPGVFADADQLLVSVEQAIAAFERTAQFAPFSSKLDNSLAGAVVLSPLESAGLALFVDPLKGNCATCHAFNAKSHAAADLLFTDFSYHVLGVPRNARIPANVDPAYFDLGLCGPKRPRVADDRLCGAFKVPTLRNVAHKKAFMHNGVFASLRDAVAFHAAGDPAPDLPPAFRANVEPGAGPLGLQEHEIDSIVAFLLTLDDGFGASRFPGAR